MSLRGASYFWRSSKASDEQGIVRARAPAQQCCGAQQCLISDSEIYLSCLPWVGRVSFGQFGTLTF